MEIVTELTRYIRGFCFYHTTPPFSWGQGEPYCEKKKHKKYHKGGDFHLQKRPSLCMGDALKEEEALQELDDRER